MNNTGNFSTYLGYVILAFILLPTFFRLLGELFGCLQQQQPIQEYEEPERVHVPFHIHNHCCGNQKKPKKTKNKRSNSKPKDLNEAFGLQQIDQTPPELVENASQALKKLGFKISEARRMTKKLCITKRYNNETDIIRDVFESGNRP
jgi:hypothetical protein